MRNGEIVTRCVNTLGMTTEEGQWVAENLYNYEMPDWSEMSWREIDTMFKATLWFKDKTDKEIEAALCAS